jgi:hypothetical protein
MASYCIKTNKMPCDKDKDKECGMLIKILAVSTGRTEESTHGLGSYVASREGTGYPVGVDFQFQDETVTLDALKRRTSPTVSSSPDRNHLFVTTHAHVRSKLRIEPNESKD